MALVAATTVQVSDTCIEDSFAYLLLNCAELHVQVLRYCTIPESFLKRVYCIYTACQVVQLPAVDVQNWTLVQSCALERWYMRLSLRIKCYLRERPFFTQRCNQVWRESSGRHCYAGHSQRIWRRLRNLETRRYAKAEHPSSSLYMYDKGTLNVLHQKVHFSSKLNSISSGYLCLALFLLCINSI